MPELPEVETMVRGIRPHVIGRPIVDVRACSNVCKPITVSPSIQALRKRLVGKEFSNVRRLGKRVVLDLENQANLVIEPRMTGLVLLSDPPDVEHLRLQWQFADSGQYDSLWFWDRRGLGVVRLFETGQLARQFGPHKLGPDAIEMTVSDWINRCSGTDRPIKVVLLDQKVVAGIGNLYASEILHLGRIHPATPASSLGKEHIDRLAAATVSILSEAIECEGSTLGDGTYRTALNQRGTYQQCHRVYMREDDLCGTCRSGKIVRFVQAQRSTFYCPVCQKVPRIRKRRPKATRTATLG